MSYIVNDMLTKKIKILQQKNISLVMCIDTFFLNGITCKGKVTAYDIDYNSFTFETNIGIIYGLYSSVNVYFSEKQQQWRISFKCECDLTYSVTSTKNTLADMLKIYRNSLIMFAQQNSRKSPFIIVTNKPHDMTGVKELFRTLGIDILRRGKGPKRTKSWQFIPWLSKSPWNRKTKVTIMANPKTIDAMYSHFYNTSETSQPVAAASSSSSSETFRKSPKIIIVHNPIAHIIKTSNNKLNIIFDDGSHIIVNPKCQIYCGSNDDDMRVLYTDQNNIQYIISVSKNYVLIPHFPSNTVHNITNAPFYFSATYDEICIGGNIILHDIKNENIIRDIVIFTAKIQHHGNTRFCFKINGEHITQESKEAFIKTLVH